MDHQYITNLCGCISVTQVYSLMTDIQQELSPASKTKPGQTTISPVKVKFVGRWVVGIISETYSTIGDKIQKLRIMTSVILC